MNDKPLTAKALGALLRTARDFDLTELEIPGVVRFKRDPKPPAPVRTAPPPGDGVDHDVIQDVSDGPEAEEEGDPRFLLEKLRSANFQPNGKQ